MGSRRCRRRRALPGSRPEMRGRTCLGRTLTREYRPVMLGKIYTARGGKASSGFLRMSGGGCSRHRQGAARCPRLPERLPRTPYLAALLNFSFCRRGPLDKPRGARYAMHRHHPPGGCYDRAERTSDSIGSFLEQAWCIGHTAQHRHATQTEVPLKQASCESRRTTKVSIPPARTPRPNGHPVKAHTRDLRKSADAASLGKRARDRSERMTSMVHWAHRQRRHAEKAGTSPTQACRKRRHPAKVGMPPKRTREAGRRRRMRLYARRRLLGSHSPRGGLVPAVGRFSGSMHAPKHRPCGRGAPAGHRQKRRSHAPASRGGAAPSLSGKRRTR